jgi:hypothetical protein
MKIVLEMELLIYRMAGFTKDNIQMAYFMGLVSYITIKV